MAKIWCEGSGESRSYDAEEFRDFGGVQVHAAGSWHLIDGTVIEMEHDGVPKLDANGRPTVLVGDLSAADAEVTGEFHVAPDAAPGEW